MRRNRRKNPRENKNFTPPFHFISTSAAVRYNCAFPHPPEHRLFTQKSRYEKDELLSCGHGRLFGRGNAQLPLPDMLMFDRIVHIDENGGEYGKGKVVAELDLHPQLWFFQCHFEDDPVMPGCLGVDALWQLLGFSLGWRGGLGYGRALGSGEIKFTGQISPHNRRVTYQIDCKRVITRAVTMGIADGTVVADGQLVYSCKDLRVGLFRNRETLSAPAKDSEAA